MSTRTLTDETTGVVALGDLKVRRLGFGAMRIWPGASGAGPRTASGEPDREAAIRLCRRVVERGVNFIDTADIYGFGMSEEILAEALHPYPSDLVIATKAGFRAGVLAPGQKSLPPIGRPEHIRAQCEQSLRRLKLDCIPVYQSHVPDPDVPYAETIGAFADLQREGKVRHVGVSNVNVEQLRIAQSICPVVSVQNRYNLGARKSEGVLEACEASGAAFLPYRPVMVEGGPAEAALAEIAAGHGASAQQIALAWLLAHSPAMLPIPGTSDVGHLDANVDAAWIRLGADEIARLEGAAAAELVRIQPQ